MSQPDEVEAAGTADEAADEVAAGAVGSEAVEPPEPPEPTWKRQQRLAEIFGDVLPSTTRDEREPGSAGPGESGSDAWLRAQVPPHHGS